MAERNGLRIAIDASAIPKQMAGAGVYTYELVRALAALESRHQLFVFTRAGVFNDALNNTSVRLIAVEQGSRAGRLAWEQTQLPLQLGRLGIDVLHSPHHHTPVAARAVSSASRLVVTIHDLTFMLIPERYPAVRRLYMQAMTRASARIANAIITPSQSVRHAVIKRLGVKEKRVVEIPEAAADCYRQMPRSDVETARARYGLPSRYVLSVGSLEPGKNRGRLFQALALLRDKGVECHCAVVGQPAWKFEADYDLIRALALSDRVSFLGYVPEHDMPALYVGATLLAFPSLHEGFGLPVLESMACGTPVVTSSVSATAEVAGDAALLVDPLDTAAIAAAIERIMGDEALRGELRERGLQRSAEFSWERTARETMLLYELVAGR